MHKASICCNTLFFSRVFFVGYSNIIEVRTWKAFGKEHVIVEGIDLEDVFYETVLEEDHDEMSTEEIDRAFNKWLESGGGTTPVCYEKGK